MLAAVILSLAPALAAEDWKSVVETAGREAPLSRILVLDTVTGQVLASRGLAAASRTLASPGSTLKPLALYSLVQSGQWEPSRRIACKRSLQVGNHNMACTHPDGAPFDAREALAWSCNSYFAQLALALRPGDLGRMLAKTNLLGSTGLATAESTAAFREPRDSTQKQLALLGVEGIRVTPLELAAAYRWLAQQLAAHPDSKAASVVAAGLEDSASFGMAGQAGLGGVSVAGKTGTAPDPASGQTNGWFAGWAPAVDPKVIVVVFVPGGRGTDAAHIAGEVLRLSPLGKR